MKFILEKTNEFGHKNFGDKQSDQKSSALILAECQREEPSKTLIKPLQEPLAPWRVSLEQLLAQKQGDCIALAVAEVAEVAKIQQAALPVCFSSIKLEAKLTELGNESAALLQWGKSLGTNIVQQKWQHVLFPTIPDLSPKQFRLVLEGLWFSCYQFDELKENSKEHKDITVSLYLDSKFDKTFLPDLEKQLEALKQTFKLVISPANICTPKFFSDFAVQQVSALKNVQATVWDEKQLKREGMNLILAVGRGSPKESRLLILDYCKDKKSNEHIALVGKGVCFDTGGTNLKPSSALKGMQYDMMGGAIVYGAFYYLASTGFSGNIKAYIPLVENQIGSDAIKTGDIIQSAMGPSVEINNTDAEGRLILADAIHCAVQQKPRLLIDCATLTGASITALGEQCAAYYSNNEEVASLFARASRETAEDTWRMPLFRPYASYLDSKLADISNISTKNSGGGSLTAALFLEKFTQQQKDKKQPENTLPWLHLDLAGWSSLDEHPSFGKNTYAMGVRLLANFLKNMAKS